MGTRLVASESDAERGRKKGHRIAVPFLLVRLVQGRTELSSSGSHSGGRCAHSGFGLGGNRLGRSSDLLDSGLDGGFGFRRSGFGLGRSRFDSLLHGRSGLLHRGLGLGGGGCFLYANSRQGVVGNLRQLLKSGVGGSNSLLNRLLDIRHAGKFLTSA